MNKPNIWDVLGFVFGCTICAVLLINIIAVSVLKIPTTSENMQLRLQLVDLLKYIAGAIIAVITMKIQNKQQ